MVRNLKNALRLLFIVPLVLALTGASGAVLADPPSRAGRLSVVEGEVALRRDSSRDWTSAAVNVPVTTGDEIATESDARAELRIGSSVLRLDQATSVEVRRLDDERIRVRLKEGSVALRIRSSDREDAIEVETRDGVATPAAPGQYRVDFVDSGTLVSNHRGHIDFRTDDRHVGVTEGRRAQIWSEGPTDVQWDEPDEDNFMEWSFARDQRDDRIARNNYVSPEMTGAEDLYEHGDWREYDDYGPVWYPRDVPYGWAPYRYGRWVSIAPWGWTWVDDAPWGFAPFHYGRWVRIRGVWAWVPGRYIARPVYAPALVGWIGTPGVSITFTSGLPNVSWFPLAPREVYVPHYRYSPTYVRQVNITHITNVIEIDRVVKTPRQVRYAFRDRSEAVTRVSERILRAPKPVALDVERRREHRFREWERRGFPVREVVRPDGTRVRTVQPAQFMQQRGDRDERQPAAREQRQDERQRLDSRQERTEALRQQQAREREERGAREQEQQRQRQLQRDQPEQRREQLRQERRDEATTRQERLEGLRQQNVREREEQGRREAAQQEEQQRQRSVVREQQEQRRDEARRAQREEVDQRQQERQQRLEAQRQQEAGEREARRQQVEQQREERGRQQAVQTQEQERRRDALRQQTEQREREVQQRQMQIQQQRQAEQQRQSEQQQRQPERQRIQREAPQRDQRDPQQDNRRSGEEEQQRRRPPFGQFEGAR